MWIVVLRLRRLRGSINDRGVDTVVKSIAQCAGKWSITEYDDAKTRGKGRLKVEASNDHAHEEQARPPN